MPKKGDSLYLDYLKTEYPEFELCFDEIPLKYRYVVEERLEGHTLQHIGNVLSISRDAVRQIEARACRRLAAYVRRLRRR